jgi:hypothetical protein
VSVNDMQEWILLLQKPVQDLENSKLLLLCKKRSLRMLNSSATQTTASGGSMQMRRKQEFLPKSFNAYDQKNPFLHCFFRQQIYIPAVFVFPGGELQGTALLASLRLASGRRPDTAGRISVWLLSTFRCKEKKAYHSALRGFRW